MRAAVRALDRRVRRKLNIVEFSDDPDCIFRVRLCEAYRDLPLPDGTVTQGEPVAEVHWWNERLPPIGEDGPGLKWAVRMRRMLITTHRLMAQELLRNPDWRDIRAVGTTTALFPAGKGAEWGRKMGRLGYVVIPHENPSGRVAEFFERVWAWLIWRTYQSGTMRVLSPFEISRSDFWMSADSMLRIYTDSEQSAEPNA